VNDVRQRAGGHGRNTWRGDINKRSERRSVTYVIAVRSADELKQLLWISRTP
jgi:hypothetical protein